MNNQHITEMFAGIDEQYKEILVRDDANKKLFIDALNKISASTAIDSIVPEPKNILNAFRKCKWDKLRVVLIGQDPYPTPGHANGLCFSVERGVEIPRSLANIYAALRTSGIMQADVPHGDLSEWAERGVLMVNMGLTTVKGGRGSHLDIWQPYMEKVLYDIAKNCAARGHILIFMLWGGYAQTMSKIVNKVNVETIEAKTGAIHRILEWGHPSPLNPHNQKDPTAHNKHFANCDNFLKCNDILREYTAVINWQLSQ